MTYNAIVTTTILLLSSAIGITIYSLDYKDATGDTIYLNDSQTITATCNSIFGGYKQSFTMHGPGSVNTLYVAHSIFGSKEQFIFANGSMTIIQKQRITEDCSITGKYGSLIKLTTGVLDEYAGLDKGLYDDWVADGSPGDPILLYADWLLKNRSRYNSLSVQEAAYIDSCTDSECREIGYELFSPNETYDVKTALREYRREIIWRGHRCNEFLQKDLVFDNEMVSGYNCHAEIE